MKILVLRFSSIGDIILTTPVIRALSNQLNAEIHYLTKQKFSSVLEGNPYIRKIWTFESNINEIEAELKTQHFDLIVDLHNNLRTFVLKKKLSVPSRSFRKANIQKWMMTNFKFDRLPKKHIVDRYMECVTSLGVLNDGEGLDYFISEKSKIDVKRIFTEIGVKDYACLVVGAAHETKTLPVDLQIKLIELIDLPVILLGGPNEILRGERIQSEKTGVTLNLVGKLSLNETAACIDRAQAVITHDTGAMHMGAARKKKMAIIWGNTIPEFGMSAYYGTHQVVHKNFGVLDLSCRPCSKIGHSVCPKSHFNCMRAQNIVEIAAFVNELN